MKHVFFKLEKRISVPHPDYSSSEGEVILKTNSKFTSKQVSFSKVEESKFQKTLKIL